MALFKYDGPVYRYGRKTEDRVVLFTDAPTIGRARANFIHRVGKENDILYNCISTVSNSWEDEYPERVCPDCGNLLQDNGDCPLCSGGDYCIYDEIKSLSTFDD
jgi:hypothetical protein